MRAEDVIVILDARSATTSQRTRDFLEVVRSERRLLAMSGPGPVKSYVVLQKNVAPSPVSSRTLARRAVTGGML